MKDDRSETHTRACGNENIVLNGWSNETSSGRKGSEESKGIVDGKPATKRKHHELKAWREPVGFL